MPKIEFNKVANRTRHECSPVNLLHIFKNTSGWVLLKYSENTKLCYMDKDSFIVNVKTEDIYKDISKDLTY